MQIEFSCFQYRVFFSAFKTVNQFFRPLRKIIPSLTAPKQWVVQMVEPLSQSRSNLSIRHRTLGDITSLVSKSTCSFPKLRPDPLELSYRVTAVISHLGANGRALKGKTRTGKHEAQLPFCVKSTLLLTLDNLNLIFILNEFL